MARQHTHVLLRFGYHQSRNGRKIRLFHKNTKSKKKNKRMIYFKDGKGHWVAKHRNGDTVTNMEFVPRVVLKANVKGTRVTGLATWRCIDPFSHLMKVVSVNLVTTPRTYPCWNLMGCLDVYVQSRERWRFDAQQE